MKPENSYLVSAPGWTTKYIRANTMTEAREIWKKITGGPDGAEVSQVLGKKPKRKGGDK